MKSRILRIVGILFLLLVILIALLPRILSSAPVRGLVLEKAAAAAPGDIEIGDWALTWNNGLRVDRLTYRDERAGTAVIVEQIEVRKGLLGLIRDHRDLGEIRIQGPVVRLEIPEARPALPTPAEGTRPPPPQPAPPTPSGPPAAPMQLPDYALDFQLEGGRIEIVAPGQTATQVIENLSIKLVMDGATKPVTYAVNCRVAGGDGTLSVEGTTTLSRDGALVIEQVTTDTDIAIDALDLGPLTAWAAAQGGVPVVHSRLSATLKASGSLAEGVRVRGNVQLPDTALSGDMLQGDRPRLGDVTLVVNASYAGDRLGISNLVFRSGVASLQATGDIGAAADGTFSADGQVDLAALARELPKTLKLQEGVTVEEGVVKLAGKVEREQGVTAFDGSASIDVLRGRRAGEPIAWDAPTRVAVRGRQGPDLLVLDHCEIASPFLTGTGSGSLDGLRLHLDASLDKAIGEAGKFVDLAGWSAAGDLAVDLSLQTADAARNLTCAITSPGLSIARNGAQIVPSGELRIEVSAAAPTPADGDPQTIRDLSASWQTWLSTGQATAGRIDLPPQDGAPAIHDLQAAAAVDLTLLAGTLHALGSLPAEMNLGGRAQFQVAAEVSPSTIQLASLSATLLDLVAVTPDGTLREGQITLRANGTIQPEVGALTFPSVVCSLGAGTVRLSDTTFADGKLAARAAGRLELKPLLATLQEFVTLPEGRSVSGSATFDADLAMAGKTASLTAEAGLSQLEILSTEGEPIREESVELKVDLAMDVEAGTLNLREASITSGAVQLRATADQTHEGDQRGLSASGELGLDLEKLAAYARALLGIELEMAGKQSQPFTFASAWKDGEAGGLIRHAKMAAGLHADRIQAFGLTIANLNIPLQLEGGKAQLKITGQVNEGQLQVLPVIDFNAEPAVATLVDPTNLLTNVQLTDQLSEELLAKIHPLFKGASDVTGQLSLGMEEFAWPLAAEARANARFNGWMKFTGLQMQTHGMLEKILTAMKVRERNVEFGDRELDFRCENERITCSPLRFSVDQHEVSIVGSMGLDQTLDYSAQIPVTESLVGRDSYKYLEGTTIRVPIRGTAAKPDLNANVLTEATGDLVKQAAQKAIKENAGKLLEGLFNK